MFTTFKDISKPLFQHNFKTILYLGAKHYIKSSFKADLMFIITLRPHTLITVQLRNYKSITHQEFSVNSGPSAHGCAFECVCPFNVRVRKRCSFFYVFALSASLLCLKVFLAMCSVCLNWQKCVFCAQAYMVRECACKWTDPTLPPSKEVIAACFL